jgi:hypothetical protein
MYLILAASTPTRDLELGQSGPRPHDAPQKSDLAATLDQNPTNHFSKVNVFRLASDRNGKAVA